jgi:DNA-binding NarL/FixJ family response regulator
MLRVIVVGGAAARARVRAEMNGSADIVAEYTTLEAARRADVDADAVVIAEPLGTGRGGDEDDQLVEPLTPREVQVLELLAEGLPNKAIAARLGISDQTVKFHVAAISSKLGAANRTDAVRRAVRRGLITL